MRLGILAVALAVCCAVTSFGGSAAASLDRFENAVLTYEQRDRLDPVAPGGTVFIGSSTFTKWRSLEQQFREFSAINRGFGGSTIAEIDHYCQRLVCKYKPAKIVFYAGTNDIAQGCSGKQVYEEFVKFERDVRAKLPEVEIYFISMSVAPSRLRWIKEYESGNALLREHIKTANHLHYIDVTPVMHDGQGRLKEEYFSFDRLHMTEQGYAAWTPIIVAALRARGKIIEPAVPVKAR